MKLSFLYTLVKVGLSNSIDVYDTEIYYTMAKIKYQRQHLTLIHFASMPMKPMKNSAKSLFYGCTTKYKYSLAIVKRQ